MIELVPMNELEFEMYLQYSIQEYAQDQARDGHVSEDEARQEAEQQYQQLLPLGLQTPAHSLCMIVDGRHAKNVGVLWFDQREQESGQQIFVNDLVIFEEFRRRGYAKQAMQHLEKQAADQGAASIGLRVFGQNESARILYEKLKYTISSMNMSKNL
jgi:ribosomal protein S18 acetylase RimI-like enzyme